MALCGCDTWSYGSYPPEEKDALFAAELVDELCLTIAPCLVGGDACRIIAGPPAGMTEFILHTVCADGGYLFPRLRRASYQLWQDLAELFRPTPVE